MGWYEVTAIIVVAFLFGVALIVAVPLALLIRMHKRAERRRRLVHRRDAGISLPSKYEHRHWVDPEP